MVSYEIHGQRSGTDAGFLPSFFRFSLLIIIPPMLHTPLSPPPDMPLNPYQAAHYHILRH
jgi:hypothetical protein